MGIIEIYRQMYGVFKTPNIKFYFGKVIHGTPYFYPWNYMGSIVRVVRGDKPKYGRCKSWVFKLFGEKYTIQIGYPIKLAILKLGWKEKYGSPRFEWSPSIQLYFFGLELSVFLVSPTSDTDNYWEMFLWYLYFCDSDLSKAEETWGWVESELSTWDYNALCIGSK